MSYQTLSSVSFSSERHSNRLPAMAGVLLAVCVLSLLVGDAPIAVVDIFRGLIGAADRVTNVIVLELRLPRMLLGVLIGAMLGASGAALQGYLRNPLAEPAILGTSNAAGLGAVISLYFGLSEAIPLALPLMAGGFALFGMILVLVFSSRSPSSVSLILAGIALGSITGAGISLALNLSTNPFAAMEISFWLLGSVEDRSLQHVAMAAPFILVALAVLITQRRALDAISLGEDVASTLGIHLGSVRVLLISAISLGVGASVAVAGAIGFIGLVAPHLARGFGEQSPSKQIIPSALIGAVLLVGADVLVRVLPTTNELKLGVVTALLGGPALVYILYQSKRSIS